MDNIESKPIEQAQILCEVCGRWHQKHKPKLNIDTKIVYTHDRKPSPTVYEVKGIFLSACGYASVDAWNGRYFTRFNSADVRVVV